MHCVWRVVLIYAIKIWLIKGEHEIELKCVWADGYVKTCNLLYGIFKSCAIWKKERKKNADVKTQLGSEPLKKIN